MPDLFLPLPSPSREQQATVTNQRSTLFICTSNIVSVTLCRSLGFAGTGQKLKLKIDVEQRLPTENGGGETDGGGGSGRDTGAGESN